MKRFKLIRQLSWKETFLLFKYTFIEFFREKTFLHSAALSYYTVLTLVPIIYLSIASFGKIIGQKTMVEIISNFLKENIGIQDVDSIIEFLNGVDFEKSNAVLQTIGLIALLISATALFNSLKYSINEFFDIEKQFDTPKKRIINNVLSRLTSLLLLTFFGLILIVTYFAQTILISIGTELFGDLSGIELFLYSLAQHGVSIISSIFTFMLIFKYLHDAYVPWKTAIAGSIFTAILLYLGQLLIKIYLNHYFFAKDGGIAGSILIILVWMYYSSQIIFLGAKFTSVYARMIGKPLQID